MPNISYKHLFEAPENKEFWFYLLKFRRTRRDSQFALASSGPFRRDKAAKIHILWNYHIPWERSNNFNENSGVEFRGKSDISCYVQSNASLPRWNNASPHTLCNSQVLPSFKSWVVRSTLDMLVCNGYDARRYVWMTAALSMIQ